MQTIQIGKSFLSLWNSRKEMALTAEAFFIQEMVPVFFMHKKHFMSVTNSPFQQAIPASYKGDPIEYRVKQLLEKIDDNYLTPDGSFAVGFAAASAESTTSGQVTGLDLGFSKEDIYFSWIGAAFAAGVDMGYCLAINNVDIMWTLYSGWQHYRDYLESTSDLKPNQIETWNTHWLVHVFGAYYNEKNPLLGFDFNAKLKKSPAGAYATALSTVKWTQLLFSLSEKLSNLKKLVAYVYSFAQTNKTIGFIILNLHEVVRMKDLIEKLFMLPEDTPNWQEMRRLYEARYSFEHVCRASAIGLVQIQPKDIKSPFNSHVQLLWYNAMLKDQQLITTAKEFATFIHRAIVSERGKTTDNRIKSLLTTNRNAFIDQCGELVEAHPGEKSLLDDMVEKAVLLNGEIFTTFITLVRYNLKSINTK